MRGEVLPWPRNLHVAQGLAGWLLGSKYGPRDSDWGSVGIHPGVLVGTSGFIWTCDIDGSGGCLYQMSEEMPEIKVVK